MSGVRRPVRCLGGAGAVRDIVEVLAEAEIEDKADLYAELGVDLTTTPKGALPSRCNRVG
jgi:hypothetical protein